MDLGKLRKKAIYYAQRQGLDPVEAEDFAQNCLIKAWEINGPINLEFMFKNYRKFERADKRILSSAQGTLSNYATISLDTPVSQEDDKSRLGDFIACQRDELADRERVDEAWGLVEGVLGLVGDSIREEVFYLYLRYLKESV